MPQAPLVSIISRRNGVSYCSSKSLSARNPSAAKKKQKIDLHSSFKLCNTTQNNKIIRFDVYQRTTPNVLQEVFVLESEALFLE
jgi:hypothetical protein